MVHFRIQAHNYRAKHQILQHYSCHKELDTCTENIKRGKSQLDDGTLAKRMQQTTNHKLSLLSCIHQIIYHSLYATKL
ncbi:hypothetical protein [Flavobacterium sp. KMS]|uniref:hypothetical protein n=1 Tax=Flavobacterium sp. KMS TaxID=1566023 RepID=UPI001039DEDB|nr:hypothetical protein [Flavobacterium sp. KMS]